MDREYTAKYDNTNTNTPNTPIHASVHEEYVHMMTAEGASPHLYVSGDAKPHQENNARGFRVNRIRVGDNIQRRVQGWGKRGERYGVSLHAYHIAHVSPSIIARFFGR